MALPPSMTYPPLKIPKKFKLFCPAERCPIWAAERTVMANYKIYTDTACDISPELLEQWGVSCTSLTFRFEGDEKEYKNNDMPANEFYERIKNGGIAKTAAANTEVFKEAFKKALDEGLDVLYLGFSSGLSTTFNSARIAGLELAEEFPERKIITVDTLCASAGFGILVYLACGKRDEGADIDTVAEFVRAKAHGLCQWFTVDDLVYLKRGGRISPTLAFVGNVLGIKPVLHVDDEGHLVNMSKVRGRRSAIAALAEKYGELAIDKEGGTVFISHADCLSDAKLLEDMLAAKYGAKVQLITGIGPVIGAHSGPGTLALFFSGEKR